MAEGYALRGIMHLSERRFPAAERGFRQAIAADPRNLEYHNYLGVILYHRGRLPEALTAFDWVLKFKPGHRAALNNKTRVHEALGQYEEAKRFTLRMKELKAREPLFQHYIGAAPVRPARVQFPSAYLPHHPKAREKPKK